MRILLAINNLGTGGAETFFCQLARALANKGHEVFIWQIFYPIVNHQYLDVLNHENINKFEFPEAYTDILCRESSGFRRIWVGRKLRRKIKSLQIDIVNSHLFEADYFIAKNVNLPQVISMHGSYEMYYLNPDIYKKDSFYGFADFNTIKSHIFTNASYIITAAQKNEIVILNSTVRPAHSTIYYGKEQSGNVNQSRTVKNIGMLSRGIETKGWDVLIQSFKILSKSHSDLTLILGFTESSYMTDLQKKYNGVEHIKWMKDVTDVSLFFSELDLFVFPTRYPAESLPNVLIESLAYQVPIISTNIGEISNMLHSSNGNAGIVISNELSEKEMIESICFEVDVLISNQTKYTQAKENCKYAFEKFDIEVNAQQYLSVFEKVVSNGK